MDDRFWKFVFDQQPEMNPRIAEGIAIRQLEGPELRIDRVWRCASKLFQEGLTYEGFKVCTPEEELAQKTRRRNGQTLELSQSDVFMVKYVFNYNGRHLVDVPLYLPFCRPEDAGSLYIRGSRFTISPVIADRCLSVSKGSVFFPPLRDKLTFTQFPWSVIIDDRPETVYVQKSKIHHYSQEAEVKKMPGSIQGHHTLMHYLFCRYGLVDTFQLHFDCDPLFGDDTTITPEKYPKDGWVIVRSVGAKPRVLKNAHYQPTNLRVAIPRHQWNGAVESAVAGFFYLADLFPERVTLEDLDSERLWCILFGVIIFGASNGEGKVLEDFRNHLASLDEYIDEVTREDLHGDGVPVDNIYELFVYIVEQMPRLLANTDVANLEGKRLITWKYVLYDIIRAIFSLTYQLNPKSRKLQEQDLKKTFTRGLSPELIMKINGAGHPEVSNISSPSDSKLNKFTTSAIPQSRAGARSSRGDHDRTFSDPQSHFHSTIMAFGSFLNQPKSDPGGGSKLNPYAELGSQDEFKVPEKFKDQLAEVQKKLAR